MDKLAIRSAPLLFCTVFGFLVGMSLTLSVQAAPQRTTTAPGSISEHSKSFSPASVRALPGLQCILHPEGGPLSAGVTVLSDDDGFARFYAVKMTANDALKRLALDCKDKAGKPRSYIVDLTSQSTFSPNPINLPGTNRPALRGDPLSYAKSQLLQAGYGMRPDPRKARKAYVLWLAAASKPGRFLRTVQSNTVFHSVTPQLPYRFLPHNFFGPANLPANINAAQGGPWYGAVLTGAPDYTFTIATFNIPTAIPGGDQTNNTTIFIWNGLGGYGTGSGLIQFFVIVQTTPTVASYWTKREYCCGDNQFTSDAGYFAPNPGDLVLDEAWYCDANGNQNINGGYGCAFFQDLTSGAIVSCTSATGSPCSSVKAFPLCSTSPGTPGCMTLGKSAEFVIENGGGLTDFSPIVNMEGYATNVAGDSYDSSGDPTVTLLTDTSANSHLEPFMSIGVNGEVEATCFAMSQIFSGSLNECSVAPPSLPMPPVGGGGDGGTGMCNNIVGGGGVLSPRGIPKCGCGGACFPQ